ncbi:DNA gyrase subunit A [Acholeplasma oculi]|uniref:DNA gyrase subunit A n=1 Tax=Acholeplasma oculi TaxID=35623 RepID=A0A061A854_9MOLU|nr:DNA gyrase subunit A [Acholeplasma oculi]CDR30080.1 DNA gyrase, subunit A [Acholeplasma oculi]SKC50047.1 DNA gyrase subunit A [Acholeplasma oculi]SUT88303.1 DNA gyrase subunit A [Acholeplasma oculi]
MSDQKDKLYDKIKEINIASEMKTSFLNYAMSVIVSRALPNAKDGLKPVQRRILYAMHENNMYANTAHKKSARIVGDVMGKYHPHGDSSIYDAMVRMAQPFSYRKTLVDGHGNFGSVDGDGAAAMRYTEARLSKIAGEMVRDLDKNTVPFVDNYDASEKEPAVLPSRYPNLLVNGSTGIAVGMATNIPPHNLGEVIDGLFAYIDNPDISVLELMQYIKGPDFPTGGQILGINGLRQAYETGKGIIAVRAKHEFVETKNRTELIITEIPYMVNKTTLIERIAEVVKNKIIEGISDLRDESSRKGMRIVIELKKDVNPMVTLNNLYKHTQLQTSFGINMIALVDGQPKLLSIKDALIHYLAHQVDIITRRTEFDLEKAEARMHILDALVKALSDVDRVIQIIRDAKTPDVARQGLIDTYAFTDIQARSILTMQLQRLTSLEIDKIYDETNALKLKISEYKDILANEDLKIEIIKNELLEIKQKYDDPRQSEINLYEDLDIDNEDLIPVEDIVVTVTNNGYIKRMNVDEYKLQNRGGVGMSGVKLHEDDYVEHILMTSTHDFHLFFTNKGRVFKLKGYKLPSGSRQSKGVPIVNFLTFQPGEKLASFTSIRNFDEENHYLFFVTKNGIVKRTHISNYQNIRQNGIIALNLKEDDELLVVKSTDGNKHILLGASNGKAIHFHEEDVREIGRTATGVRGMSLDNNDKIVGFAVIDAIEDDILIITEKGYGKRTSIQEYRLQNRGGKGVKTLNVTEKNGKLSTLRKVTNDEDLIVVSDKGITIRMPINQISQTKRATQGVRIISLKGDQKVATIAIVPHQEEIKEEIESAHITQEQMALNPQKPQVQVVELEALASDNETDTDETLEQIKLDLE